MCCCAHLQGAGGRQRQPAADPEGHRAGLEQGPRPGIRGHGAPPPPLLPPLAVYHTECEYQSHPQSASHMHWAVLGDPVRCPANRVATRCVER